MLTAGYLLHCLVAADIIHPLLGLEVNSLASTVAVGLLGVGTIGGAIAKTLTQKQDAIAARCGHTIYIKRALVRDLAKPRSASISPDIITSYVDDVISDPEIAVIIEALGGVSPAYEYVRQAILSGKHVVTTNKDMLAAHGEELLSLAQEHEVELGFEASVGAGIPIIAALRRSLVANDVSGIQGIVNGTTNYILTEMEEKGRDFASVLREAQELGYAEPDPTNDVAGYDSRYKLTVLCGLALGVWLPVESIHCEGITKLSPVDYLLAHELGYCIKLLAIARQREEGLEARVQPMLVPLTNMLAGVRGVYNAIQIHGDLIGEIVFYGRGAGPDTTASAVLGDLTSIVRGERWLQQRAPASFSLIPVERIPSRFYLRLEIADRTAARSAMERLAAMGIGVSATRASEGGMLALVTDVTSPTLLERAVEDLAILPAVRRVATVLSLAE
jgi:homoserine dehydrogenase